MIRITSALLILLSLILATPTLAQDESSQMSGEGLGLPELQISVTDEGWDAPTETPAGRYLITASYQGDRDFGTVAFLNLPSDWTIEDLNEQLADGDAATPDGDSNGTTVASTVVSMDWLYDLTLAGGVSPIAGGTAQGIVDLAPGNWAIWSDGFTPAAIALTVTGEMPAALPEPSSAITVTGTNNDESFAFTIEGTFESGTQLVKVVNSSNQPQFLEVVQMSSVVTGDQLQQYFLTEEGATPTADSDLPAGLEVWLTPLYAGTQSPGTTQWMVATIAPGAYAMVCWLPDPEHNNESHAQRGMITVFEVL